MNIQNDSNIFLYLCTSCSWRHDSISTPYVSTPWSILPLTAILFINFLQNHCMRRIPGYYGSNLAENSTHAKYGFCEDRSSLSAYLESNLQITNSLFARSIFILFLIIFVVCKQNVYDQSQKTINKFCKTAWNRIYASVPYLSKNCRNLPLVVYLWIEIESFSSFRPSSGVRSLLSLCSSSKSLIQSLIKLFLIICSAIMLFYFMHRKNPNWVFATNSNFYNFIFVTFVISNLDYLIQQDS